MKLQQNRVFLAFLQTLIKTIWKSQPEIQSDTSFLTSEQRLLERSKTLH